MSFQISPHGDILVEGSFKRMRVVRCVQSKLNHVRPDGGDERGSIIPVLAQHAASEGPRSFAVRWTDSELPQEVVLLCGSA